MHTSCTAGSFSCMGAKRMLSAPAPFGILLQLEPHRSTASNWVSTIRQTARATAATAHHALQRSMKVVDDVRAPAHAALSLHHQFIRMVRVICGRVRVMRDVLHDNLLRGPAPMASSGFAQPSWVWPFCWFGCNRGLQALSNWH